MKYFYINLLLVSNSSWPNLYLYYHKHFWLLEPCRIQCSELQCYVTHLKSNLKAQFYLTSITIIIIRHPKRIISSENLQLGSFWILQYCQSKKEIFFWLLVYNLSSSKVLDSMKMDELLILEGVNMLCFGTNHWRSLISKYY